jgi:hypothetical protein
VELQGGAKGPVLGGKERIVGGDSRCDFGGAIGGLSPPTLFKKISFFLLCSSPASLHSRKGVASLGGLSPPAGLLFFA